jgi:hypothetical protein
MSYLAFGQSNMEGFPGIDAGDKEDDGERDGFPVAASAGFAVGQSITVGTGADQQAATIAQVQGGRRGARLTVTGRSTSLMRRVHRWPAAASRWRRRSRGTIPAARG